ncbi:MAG TPA: hypothetical protein VD902_20040 [Symbiobacteriaceae bacterium]|nr:hypothetical protein [Symbiobacteriaceae bacterium]
MKLEPGERSVLASFKSGPDAEAAKKALQQAGFTEVQMDRIGKFGFRPDLDERRPAISGNESSQVKAILNPGRQDGNTAVLLGATTEVSGMSAPSTQDEMPFLITVVTVEDRLDEAVHLITQHGGRV